MELHFLQLLENRHTPNEVVVVSGSTGGRSSYAPKVSNIQLITRELAEREHLGN